ncbi:MAG: hypothetical protein ACRDNM_01480 [Gaiellaceae bacterium]
MTIIVRPWHLVALAGLLATAGIAAAFMLGRSSSSPTTTTVLDVLTGAFDAPPEPTRATDVDLRSTIPAAEAWYQDASGGNQSYAGLSLVGLQRESPGVSLQVHAYVSRDFTAYCLDVTLAGGHSAYYIGGDRNGFRHLSAQAGRFSVIDGGTCASAGATAGS